MSQVEIIKFTGQPARIKTPLDVPPFENLEEWRFVEQVIPTPLEYDSATQYLNSHDELTENGWERVWAIADYTPEQIAARQPPLNWEGFIDALIDFAPDSTYSQLQTWANAAGNNQFVNSLNNISFALNQQKEALIYASLKDLNNKATGDFSFSESQIAEINNCLSILGVVWTWESL